jgi:hypothetical protein
MTIEQLIAEITSGGFSHYDQSGLINYTDLRTWIKAELKRFGSNLMFNNEAFVYIKDGKAKLPNNFWQLDAAIECGDACGYVNDEVTPVKQSSLFFKERIEGTMEWDNTSESYVGKDFTYVKEDLYFQGTHATVYYDKYKALKLVKGFDRTICSKGCLNLNPAVFGKKANEINITNDYLNANFNKGSIYLRYTGLGMDDSGQLIIPTTQHDRLKDYLIYYCRMRVLEDLAVGGDSDVLNLLSYFNEKQRLAFMLAQTEVKMGALGKDWTRKVRNKARVQTLKYDVMLPKR